MQGWVDLGTMGANSLPKTATRQRRSRLRFEPVLFRAWVWHTNHSATEPPSKYNVPCMHLSDGCSYYTMYPKKLQHYYFAKIIIGTHILQWIWHKIHIHRLLLKGVCIMPCELLSSSDCDCFLEFCSYVLYTCKEPAYGLHVCGTAQCCVLC